MIEVNLRDKNQIIHVTVFGKAPIRGRISSSQYFHTPLELLLSSLGLCIGGIINNYCRMNDINTSIFERITVTLNGEHYEVTIKRPKDFSDEHITRLSTEIQTCPISRELKKDVRISWDLNTIPTETLLKVAVAQPCCGGK